jgi:hypothetical protein
MKPLEIFVFKIVAVHNVGQFYTTQKKKNLKAEKRNIELYNVNQVGSECMQFSLDVYYALCLLTFHLSTVLNINCICIII